MCGMRIIRPDFAVVARSPGGFDSVMVGLRRRRHMNGELLDRVGTAISRLRCVTRDPIGDGLSGGALS